MLFSEEKERQNRFLLSLKIVFFPFIFILVIIYFIAYKFNEVIDLEDIILLTILFVLYVYYVIYIIYLGFRNSLLDHVTRVFKREYMYKAISKVVEKDVEQNIVLITLNNIQDINERYGYTNGDIILRKFIIKLGDFFNSHNMRNISIGRYYGGNFIFITKEKISKLKHNLGIFSSKISNSGINNIEAVVKFAIISSKFDTNVQNIINNLFLEIQDKNENSNIIKVDYFDELICYSIDNKEFNIKFQKIKSINDKNDIFDLNIKLVNNEVGIIPKNKILYITQNNNYEIIYDIKLISYLSEHINFDNLNKKIIIEISPISLRNIEFKNSILYLIDKNKINPNKIIFEIYEKTSYEQINRFLEIIRDFKKLGFEFAISHFGGDNPSLRYIKNYDFDYAIYDIDFNKTIFQEKTKKLVKNYNQMLRELNIKTIVRYVDKEDIYNQFKELNIDYIHGFYLKKIKDK